MIKLNSIEEQIIELFSAGLNNCEISATLNIPQDTTSCYITDLYKKLKARETSKIKGANAP